MMNYVENSKSYFLQEFIFRKRITFFEMKENVEENFNYWFIRNMATQCKFVT